MAGRDLQDKHTLCCDNGLAFRYQGKHRLLTDRICPTHPDLGAETRAKAWVKSALHMVANGKTAEARKLFLGEE